MKSLPVPIFDGPLAATIADEADRRPSARLLAVYEPETGGLYCARVEERVIIRWQVIGPLDPADVMPAVRAFGVPADEIAMFELPAERKLVKLQPDTLTH